MTVKINMDYILKQMDRKEKLYLATQILLIDALDNNCEETNELEEKLLNFINTIK